MNINEQKEELKEFFTHIPSFPLDISIAAYYIKATNVSYSQYIENLKQNHQGFASLQKDILEDTGKYRQTRYEIISLSLKKLIQTDKDFLELLLLISLLDSQNIPRDLIDSYNSKFITDKLIYNLKKYSLVFNTERKAELFSLHRSTQKIMLKYLEENYISRNINLLQRVANNLKQYLVKTLDKEDFSKINLLSNHCEIFLTHSRFLTNEIKGSIGSELGFIYFCLGDLSKSRKLLEESIMYLKKDLTSNNKLLARSLGHLGITYRDFGDFKKAKDVLEQSLKIYTFIKDQLGVAWVLSYLGLIHKNLGNYSDATSYLEQSLTIYEKNKFTNNVGLGRALGHLGIVNLEIGNYLKARALFQESLQIHKSNIIENSLNIAWDLAHIGIVDTILGDYNKAKQSLEQSLTIYEKNFPKNSIRYTWVMAHLGEVYTFLGDYKKALNLFEISIDTYRKNFPIESSKTHVSIAWILSMLGSAYIKMKNYKEAKFLFQKIIISYKQHYGENHTTYASILRKMGQIYFLNGEVESAEKSIKRTLELFQKVNHPESYIDLELLADIYLKKAENESIKLKKDKTKIFIDQGTNYLKQALKILQAHFPKDSCHIIRIQNKLKNGLKII
ncbi:MAG: hypothetical protein BGO77_02805 [Caedibacter sp. 37-49]|nr:MAG: hypothetical protein BGO77_02805 [Caedibacter sp. 37-49]